VNWGKKKRNYKGKKKKRAQVKKNKVALVSSFYINEKHIEENIMQQELTAHEKRIPCSVLGVIDHATHGKMDAPTPFSCLACRLHARLLALRRYTNKQLLVLVSYQTSVPAGAFIVCQSASRSICYY
jgi:hypothetical protein